MQVPRAKNSKLRTGCVVSVDRFLDRPSSASKPKQASSALRPPYRSQHNPREAPPQAAERAQKLCRAQISSPVEDPIVNLVSTCRPADASAILAVPLVGAHPLCLTRQTTRDAQRIRSNNPCHSMDPSVVSPTTRWLSKTLPAKLIGPKWLFSRVLEFAHHTWIRKRSCTQSSQLHLLYNQY